MLDKLPEIFLCMSFIILIFNSIKYFFYNNYRIISVVRLYHKHSLLNSIKAKCFIIDWKKFTMYSL